MIRPESDRPSSVEVWAISETKNDIHLQETGRVTIKVYKMRWYILAVICLANISNAINWICYSVIANLTGNFYSIDYEQVNFLSLAYMIIGIPSGFFSFWFIDSFGIRSSINLGVWFNFAGSVLKLLTSIENVSGSLIIDTKYGYAVLMLGQCVCALSQPFLLFITTKFANSWFAENQRALANALCLGSGTLGMLIGALISPIVIETHIWRLSGMGLLHVICGVSAFIPAIMACFILRSTPKYPPSFSAVISDDQANIENNDQSETGNQVSKHFKSYLNHVNKLFQSNDFIILLVCFGFGSGLFNALSTLIQQIICTRGYTDNDAGYFGACLIVSGMIGSVIAGIVVDKTKKFEETAKICFIVTTLSNLTFCLFQLHDNDNAAFYYLSVLSIGLFGLFGLPLLPVCMEMCVECVFPVPEATATGLLFTSGKIFMPFK
jgi:FLVCR family MFS transporter 7